MIFYFVLIFSTDVSIVLGKNTEWRYIKLQFHFKYKFTDDQPPDNSSGVIIYYTTKRTKYFANRFTTRTTIADSPSIPAGSLNFPFTYKCLIEIDRPIIISKVTVHVHSYGRQVGIFLKNTNNGWNRIFENNQPVDRFIHQVEPSIRLDENFQLIIRCIYDTTSVNHSVSIGTRDEDEMCMVHFYYHTESMDYSVKNCLKGHPINHHGKGDDYQLPAPVEIKSQPTEKQLAVLPIFILYKPIESNFLIFYNVAFTLIALFVFFFFYYYYYYLLKRKHHRIEREF